MRAIRSAMVRALASSALCRRVVCVVNVSPCSRLPGIGMRQHIGAQHTTRPREPTGSRVLLR